MTIKFKTVRYRNLLSTGNIFTEIQLDNHKNTLIIGDNGSGKSTILEAISFALYGKPMRNINKPQLINSITGKGLLVEIKFSISNKNYLVRRGMKPNLFEIFVDEKLLNQASASKDYQEILETQILKLNHKSFCQIIVLSIANYTPFMKLTAAGRREVIEDFLDIQIFSVMNNLLKEKIIQNKLDIQSVESDIRLIENTIEMHKRHLTEINQNNKDLIKKNKIQIKKYENENKKLFILIEKNNDGLKQLYTQISNEKSVQIEMTNKISVLNMIGNKQKALEKEINFFTKTPTCPTCKQHIDDNFKDQEIAKKNSILIESKKAVIVIENTIKKLENKMKTFEDINSKITKLNQSNSESNIRISTNNRIIETISNEIRQLEERGIKIKQDNHEMNSYMINLNDTNKLKESHINNKEILNMASQLLKDGGIKTRIIRQYIPIINKLINKYLAQLEFFVQFELDETFKETIKSRFRDEFTYDSFSQGEKLRLDLALLFTWRDIAKLRNSSSANLCMFDEILDSSLDASGIDELLKILNDVSPDTNNFIISHRGDTIIDKFDNVIKFQKIKSFSRIAA